MWGGLPRDAVDAQCKPDMDALYACKKRLGLHPKQCYPPDLAGGCDGAEQAVKRCLAFATDPRSAAILYNPQSPRQSRVEANQRLQKALRAFNTECTW